MELPEILKALERNTGRFPRKAVEAAIEKREEITPALLRILEDTINRAEEIVDDDPESEYFAHIYALYLLAQFRETRAYTLVVRLARLDGDLLDDLMGESVVDGLQYFLASVCGGDSRPIEELIEDPKVGEWVRSTALDALVVLVAEGDKSRDDVVAYFGALFESKLERTHSHVWNGWVACAVDIHPYGLIDHIKAAFELGLIDSAYISPNEVHKALERSKESTLEGLRTKSHGYVRSVVDDMRWWACFETTKRPTPREKPVTPPQESDRQDGGSPKREFFRTPHHPYHAPVKIGRNDPCPCDSGKKYKKCCGRMG